MVTINLTHNNNYGMNYKSYIDYFQPLLFE